MHFIFRYFKDNGKGSKFESQDVTDVQEKRKKPERSRSLDPELEERSQSFKELKKIFQDPNLSHVLIKSYSSLDSLDALENKVKTTSVKRNDFNLETSTKSQTKKKVSPKSKSKESVQTVNYNTKNSVQDINEELHDKLRIKRSVDKVSARFSNGGSMRRKNKNKV